MNNKQIIYQLKSTFNYDYSKKIVGYFSRSIQKFDQGDWEHSLVQTGKFVEVVIKTIWQFSGNTMPKKEKEFKVGDYVQKIMKLPKSKIHDGLRIQIPRACIFLYDITSNRGGRHDSNEYDPNEMNATTAVRLCSWILAEFLRFCIKKDVSPSQVHSIIQSIIKKRYPFFEEIEGRIYVEKKIYKSVNECAILILYKKYPQRLSKEELIFHITRNGHKKSSINFSRLSPFIDKDDNGIVLRLISGVKKAEKIIANR